MLRWFRSVVPRHDSPTARRRRASSWLRSIAIISSHRGSPSARRVHEARRTGRCAAHRASILPRLDDCYREATEIHGDHEPPLTPAALVAVTENRIEPGLTPGIVQVSTEVVEQAYPPVELETA